MPRARRLSVLLALSFAPRARFRGERRPRDMRIVVVGAGSWGSAFACLLRDRGHEVTLAARDAEQIAAIAKTGRNPRYAKRADLAGIAATTIEAAPFEQAELVAVAVPSAVFADVVDGIPGSSPVLSLAK
ncbi:MAG: hypothetical protein E6G28_09495, partial [Actinobacteria bacterium]